MEAIVVHYRQGRHHTHMKQMVLKIGDTVEEAKKVIGKTAAWTSKGGTVIKGTISALHGRNGNVRVIFAEKGLPGQALGQKVKIE